MKSKALVVDDNKVNRMIHCKLLDAIGIKNQAVSNGEEAIDVHLSGQKFDLILMDRDMPFMNGIQATKKLRDMGIVSVIVGVSSRSEEAEMVEFKEAGLDYLYEKPLTVAKLRSLVSSNRVLKKK